MTEQQSDQRLLSLQVRLVELQSVYCLSIKTDYEPVSHEATGKMWETTETSEEAQDSLILTKGSYELYVYSSERALKMVEQQLRVEPQFEAAELVFFKTSLANLLTKIQQTPDSVMHVNYALDSAFDVRSKEVEKLDRLTLIVGLSKHRRIYVLQNRNGMAMFRRKGGKKYSVGFLTQEDGAETVASLQEKSPGAHLEPNKPVFVAFDLLGSEFEGLILNHKSETETVLSPDDLELLVAVTNASKGSMTNMFKNILELEKE